MKRLLVLVVVALMAAAVWGIPAADNGLMKGTPNSDHLYLYEKENYCNYNYGTDCWTIVDHGAWGKMQFWPDSFVFNGHGLMPETDYCLINYVDPWPGSGSLLLGMGTSNMGGNVNIAEMFDFCDVMPADMAKIWLVPCADFGQPVGADGMQMIAWNPEMYLFEYATISAPECVEE